MKIRLVSDGTLEGTKVYSIDSGEILENVAFVSWAISAKDNVPYAIIRVKEVPAQLVAEVQ